MENTPATPQTGGQSNLSGQVLFYKEPQPLAAEQHAALGVKKIEQPFGFLREAHAVPVTVSEFGACAVSFPIIFVGEELTPVAVMGVRQGQNLFVNAEGEVDQDVYVPAFVRRYPFVFAADEGSDRLLLCVDRQAPMVSNQPEVPFFENGQPSKFTNDAIEFCKEFERQRRATVDFVAVLKKHNLLEAKTVTFQPRDGQGNEVGDPQKIADYHAVSEEKLASLSNEQFIELRDTGALGACYAHMVSLMNWTHIIQRAVRLSQDQPQQAAGVPVA